MLMLAVGLAVLMAALPTNDAAGEEMPTLRLESANLGYPSPFTHYPRQRGYIMKLLFDSLLEIDEEGYIPWLAEDWTISEQGTEHRIRIRDNVRWHDGRDLTARDVAFSLRYFQEHPPVFIDDQVADPDFLYDVEVLSGQELLLRTREASATFQAEAGRVRIIPEHIWQDVDDPYAWTEPEAVIGSGPYQLDSYDSRHHSYRLTAFADFWGPAQRAGAIELVPVSDSIAAFQQGSIDLARISPDLVQRFESDPEVSIEESPALAGLLLSFNMEGSGILQDVRFRRAVAYAIDQEDLIAKIARGTAKPGSAGILPFDHPQNNPDVVQYDHDPVRAQELLQELAFDHSRQFELLTGEGSQVRLAELLRSQLADVGIDLSIRAVDDRTRDSLVMEGNYQLALAAWGSWGQDPDYLRLRYGNGGDGDAQRSMGTALAGRGYSNPEFNRLAAEQLVETDPARRRELIDAMQDILAADVPEIPLYNSFHIFVHRPDHYDGWTFMYYHPVLHHSKLSYLVRGERPAWE